MRLFTVQSDRARRWGRGPKLVRVLALCVAAWAAIPVAHAKRDEAPSPPPQRRDAGADEAAAQARRQSGGRVLSTQPDGDDRYRVKVLTPQGRVKKIVVDRDE